MSRLLTDAARQAGTIGPFRPSEPQLRDYQLGKDFAAEVVDTLRAGEVSPRLLFCSAGMMAFAGEAAAAGFWTELQRLVAEDLP